MYYHVASKKGDCDIRVCARVVQSLSWVIGVFFVGALTEIAILLSRTSMEESMD